MWFVFLLLECQFPLLNYFETFVKNLMPPLEITQKMHINKQIMVVSRKTLPNNSVCIEV